MSRASDRLAKRMLGKKGDINRKSYRLMKTNDGMAKYGKDHNKKRSELVNAFMNVRVEKKVQMFCRDN